MHMQEGKVDGFEKQRDAKKKEWMYEKNAEV